MTIRAWRPEDTEGVVATVRSVFDEYGFTWDAEGYCSDLNDAGTEYDRFWVVEHEGQVVGCVGLELHETIPGMPGTATVVDGVPRVAATDCELVRLYVRSEARGCGLGVRLTRTVLNEARGLGRQAVELWSDKKLVHAHLMYQSFGATIVGERICPGDPDESLEWGFILPVQA